MNEATVRVGFIGAGRWSKNVMIPHFAAIPGVRLVAVANSNEESTALVAREFGFERAARDWRDVATAPDIDAIVLGTRTDMHREMVAPILDAGKHLLTMNALARTAAEAREMQRTAAGRPRQVALIYPAVAGPFYTNEDAMMRSLLASGYVGQVLQVLTYWHTPFFGLGSMFEAGHRWFGEHTRVLGYRKGYEVASTVEPHAGREVRAQSNMALAELSSGGTITYMHSTIAGESAKARFEITGSEGVLVCYASGQEMAGFYGARSGSTRLEPLPIPPEFQDSLANGVAVEAEFIAAVRSERTASPVLPRLYDGLKMLEFTEGWRESVDAGAWRDLPAS